MTPQKLEILRHTTRNNNQFVASPGSADFRVCMELVEEGLMLDYGYRKLFQGNCLVVTAKGREALREHTPPPPKLTRGQIRYREWRSGLCDLSFGDWLKRRAEAGKVGPD